MIRHPRTNKPLTDSDVRNMLEAIDRAYAHLDSYGIVSGSEGHEIEYERQTEVFKLLHPYTSLMIGGEAIETV